MSKMNLMWLDNLKHGARPFNFTPNAETDSLIVSGEQVDNSHVHEFIYRRRRQMIIHSVIYYRLNDSIVSDHTWQSWANELRDVQNRWPELKYIGYHDDLFVDWDGSTGMHLDLPEYYSQAQSILAYHQKM